jgi:hypothetical protein
MPPGAGFDVCGCREGERGGCSDDEAGFEGREGEEGLDGKAGEDRRELSCGTTTPQAPHVASVEDRWGGGRG